MKTNHGTTLECFADFIGRIPPDELVEKRRELAQLLSVEESSVRRWITGPSVPVGTSIIGLRCYLDFLGYQVSEFTALPNLLQDASRLLAFQVMTLEDMAKLTGYEAYPDKLLAVLRGVRGFSAEREGQLHDLVIAYKQEFVEKLQTVPKLIVMKGPLSPTEVSSDSLNRPVPVVATPTTTSRPTPKKILQRDERFKGLVLNLLNFAQFYANPEVPEEVRDQLRVAVGQQNIFDLKNLLSRLCSSKAFSNQQ